MIVIKFYLCLMPLLLSCNDTSKNNIEVVGIAYNEKDGAWVQSNVNNKNYFLDGIDSWDEKIVGKKVKVWGKLLIEELKQKPKEKLPNQEIPPPIPQQIEGATKMTILKAKWSQIR